MTITIYRQIPLIEDQLIQEISRYSVADLHEALGPVQGRMALMHPRIRSLSAGLRVCGQAVTAYAHPGDGLLGHKAIQLLKPGQVLVVACNEATPTTMFAELVALSARQKGAAGAIVDGCLRDSDALREMKFPVWSAGIHPVGAGKRGPGAVNVPIVCGGALVEPGDLIVGDSDGVISIPKALVSKALDGARARAQREIKVRAAIAAGESLFDLMGLQSVLDDLGAVEFDSTWEDATKQGERK